MYAKIRIWPAPLRLFYAAKEKVLIPAILAFSTSGSTTLFTTSIQEEGIVFDNDPVGSGRSDFGIISFHL